MMTVLGKHHSARSQVHQVFELWFKLIIQELIEASQLLEQSFVPEVTIRFDTEESSI